MTPVSQDRMEEALDYLSSTDESCAALKSNTERMEFRAKRTKATIFKLSEGSVAERNAIADTAPETEAAYELYFKALQDSDAMKNKRATETIVIDVWRSLNAGRRQGS